ncbi:nucleotide-sugar transporter-domain-containing protein [Mucidula mucida]|nr:nucleotide-sugar transporter-domain-containing protein [Mucidula mucida]
MSQHSNAHLNMDGDSKHDVDADDLALASDVTTAPAVPSLWGVPLKYISLVTLAVQNSALTIIMHYSRVSTPPSRAYSAATAVLMNEILKGFISLVFAFSRIDASPPLAIPFSFSPETSQSAGNCRASSLLLRVKKLCREVFSPDCWKLSIPAILYVRCRIKFGGRDVPSQLPDENPDHGGILGAPAAQAAALDPMDRASLPRHRRRRGSDSIGLRQNGDSTSPNAHTLNATKGFLAVVAACFTSGLAGVYFEMVLKNSPGDLWVRNVQLSLFSLIPCIAPILMTQQANTQGGIAGWMAAFFHDFGPWAWATVCVQVFGGLVTAMVIKYSDNILKGFATSLSIVISFLASVALFDFRITFTFVLGSAIVLNATWLYNQQPRRIGLGGQRDNKTWNSIGWPVNEKRSGLAYRSPSTVPMLGSGLSSSTTSRTSSFVSLSAVTTNALPLVPESDMFTKEKL